MKCSFCSSELPDGSEFCPECGMILSLGDNDMQNESAPEQQNDNVFRADVPQNETSVAMELEADTTEEIVPVVEGIPEYVSNIPVEPEIQPTVQREPDQQAQDEPQEVSVPVSYNLEDDLGDDAVISHETVSDEEKENIIINSAFDDDDESIFDEEDDELSAEDDEYLQTRKIKNGYAIVAILVVLLAFLVACGAYVIKNVLPAKADVTTTAESTSSEFVFGSDVSDEADLTNSMATTTSNVADDESTEKETTEEETTENESTTEESTTKESTTKESTTKESTTKESTTKGSTTKESTTKPTTTKPTTTKPTTTKPTTTKPTTTKPSTTKDPYGINDVTVKKPSSYLSSSFNATVTANGLTLRSGPSTSYERVHFMSQGDSVTVYAKENGFYYVRCNRYGTYGWASVSYISSGSSTETTKATTTGPLQSGSVSPDQSGSGNKTTAYELNLRKGPSTSYGIVKTLPVGSKLQVLGYKSGVSGWVYVKDVSSGLTGWVSSAYIR